MPQIGLPLMQACETFKKRSNPDLQGDKARKRSSPKSKEHLCLPEHIVSTISRASDLQPRYPKSSLMHLPRCMWPYSADKTWMNSPDWHDASLVSWTQYSSLKAASNVGQNLTQRNNILLTSPPTSLEITDQQNNS
jgi:hypothetical protein